MSYPIERSHYRIKYPMRERPQLTLGERVHAVVDCSEFGIRYLAGRTALPEIGAEVEGRIRFGRGAEADITGTVVRVASDGIALRLKSPIPLRIIIDEQRYLRINYPMSQ
jgi:hypothetical protein